MRPYRADACDENPDPEEEEMTPQDWREDFHDCLVAISTEATELVVTPAVAKDFFWLDKLMETVRDSASHLREEVSPD